MMNVYRAYTCIQNAIDQTAMQVSEYAYIAKKLGVHNIGQGASSEAGEFTDKTKKMLNTVQVFFNASANGLENATDVTSNILDEGTEQYPEDILSQMNSVGQSAQEIYDAGQAMHTSVTDYFSDEKAIFKPYFLCFCICRRAKSKRFSNRYLFKSWTKFNKKDKYEP